MKTRLLMLGTVTIALLTSFPVHAQSRTTFITVEELSQDCAGEGQICMGFIVGVADALEATAWPAKRSCRGNEVLLQDVLERAAGLLFEVPANKADGPAFDYLADNFVETWLC